MKLKFILQLLAVVSSLCCAVAAKNSYVAHALTPEDLAAVLSSGMSAATKNAESLPADITFGVADIKFDETGRVTICEGGDGCYCSLRECNITFNDHQYWQTAPFWGIFWNYVHQFKLPMWHVGIRGPANALALEEHARLGGTYFKRFADLEKDSQFIRNCKHIRERRRRDGVLTRAHATSDYAGIVTYVALEERDRDGKEFTAFKARHPELLVVNAVARDVLKRKDRMYQLFADAGLTDFIPQFNVYPSEYSPELVAKILADFQQEKLIIKPVWSSLSCGVNAIDRQGLDGLLRMILRDKQSVPANAGRGLAYWRSMHDKSFVVCAYMPSKTLVVNDKSYDPTMRIVFMLHRDGGVAQVNLLGGFWKIPVKSLDQQVPLTEKHVTIAHAGDHYTGILVAPDDMQRLKQTFEPALLHAYDVMLQQAAEPKAVVLERRFVFIVPSYNNKDWYERNLTSIFSQKYSNYHVIYVDDASTDGTADLVEKFVADKGKHAQVTLIRNTARQRMAYNRYIAIHKCQDSDICLALDGDDWLPHDGVLQFYNNLYADPDIWLTYGHYEIYPGGKRGPYSRQIPPNVIKNNSFRQHPWSASHMKTFYAGLFKKVPVEAFMRDGKFLTSSTDVAMMWPMLEMAHDHSKFVPEVMYVYNEANQLNLFKKNLSEQYNNELFLRKQKPFAPLTPNQAGWSGQ